MYEAFCEQNCLNCKYEEHPCPIAAFILLGNNVEDGKFFTDDDGNCLMLLMAKKDLYKNKNQTKLELL